MKHVFMDKIKLSELSTLPPANADKDEYQEKTKQILEQLEEWQNKLYAQRKYSLLVIVQGMDASGKDGAIKKVFSGVNPMGINVKSFKKPTEEEMSHDFLWRIHKCVPEKGMIQIFNRSHYEDVVIQRVHAWVDDKTILRRYDHINAFENLLKENNTTILKFYLHISHKEQLERLEERKTDSTKMWKHNPNDAEESKLWKDYMNAYEDALNQCNEASKWHVVPSDKNWFKEYLIAKTITDTLEAINPAYPSLKL